MTLQRTDAVNRWASSHNDLTVTAHDRRRSQSSNDRRRQLAPLCRAMSAVSSTIEHRC
jgi:hypothetical protein